MSRLAIAAAFTGVCAVWGQSAAPMAFEVASVKQAAPNRGQARRRPTAGTDRIDFQNVTLWYCISYAYGMKSYQMSGPGWLRTERYDIVAKGPEGTRRADLPKMMQALLVERFQLRVHEETREMPTLALIPGNDGPKLKEAGAESGDGQGGAQVGMSALESGGERLDVKGGRMTTLVNTLTGCSASRWWTRRG
jgi:uncharacterized protein (TIGR03435 family)